MKDAEKRLTEVAEKSSIPALNPALAAEQAAYQALLKLRAREFQVIRNNSRRQQQSGRSSGGQHGAAAATTARARRPTKTATKSSDRRGPGKRTSRSESASSAKRGKCSIGCASWPSASPTSTNGSRSCSRPSKRPRPPHARQEIERQLKRLRDQQQQILRDTDELQERMEQEENRDRMADAREQIEQGREHVRQASEALEQGQLSAGADRGSTGRPPVERPA